MPRSKTSTKRGANPSQGHAQNTAAPEVEICEGRKHLAEGWRWVTLKEIAHIAGGVTKGQKRRPNEVVRQVPYLRVANVQRGYLDLTEMKEIEASESEIEALSLQPGDILFNEGGDRDKLGRGWVWNGELPVCVHQNHVFRARLKDSEDQPKFISFYGNSKGQRYFMEQGKQTTNLASINLTKLGALPIPLPPPEEQRRIVAEIEKQFTRLDAGVAALRRVQANLKRYRNSVLNEAASVSWPSMMLSEISEVITGATPSKERPEYYGGALPFIKPGDLNVGYRVENAKEHLSEEGAREARVLPPNTVLVTCIGATIGKSGLARVPCATNQQINSIIPHDHIVLSEWIYWMISSPFGQQQIKAKASATTLPILNKGKFSAIMLPIPPLAEQAGIVADIEKRLSVADALERTVHDSLRRSERMRQSVLRAAFNGEF